MLIYSFILPAHYIPLSFFFHFFSLCLCAHFSQDLEPSFVYLQSPFSHSVNPRQNTQHLLWREDQQTTTATTGTILRVAFFHSTKLNMYLFLPLPQKITYEEESLLLLVYALKEVWPNYIHFHLFLQNLSINPFFRVYFLLCRVAGVMFSVNWWYNLYILAESFKGLHPQNFKIAR